MRAFSCLRCRQLVFFENTACLRCGAPLGFPPDASALLALEPVAGDADVLAVTGTEELGRRFRRCERFALGCNWLVPDDDPEPRCGSCRLTRTAPDVSCADAMAAYGRAEADKRRLLFQLLDLGLPVVGRDTDPDRGLAFDLVWRPDGGAVIGHASGVITLDLGESDDAYREQVRQQLGEPYRTLLGHFRHEIGHYYWMTLVEGSPHLDEFRRVFGDERADYAAAIDRHYAHGPRPDWWEHHVSAYATMHPWEDWAETFAHYLHIRDTLQTAVEFGLRVEGPRDDPAHRRDPGLVSPDLERAAQASSFEALIAAWLPLTYALNAVNRSMGRPDLYPFVLTPAVIAKLAFVHGLVSAW